MSGLEIVALIPAIISAFGTISTEYREWRKRRQDRSQKRSNVALQKLLAGNGGAVQDEYDEDLQALGPVFKRGDGIARESLMHHLIILQSTVISLLNDRRNDISYLVHPNHDSIANGASSSRDGIVSTLAQQYQRFTQARPIARLPAPSSSQRAGNCLNCPDKTSNVMDAGSISVSGVDLVNFGQFHCIRYNCDECDWKYCMYSSWAKVKTKDGRILDNDMVVARFHYRDPLRRVKNGFRCYLCGLELFQPEGIASIFATSPEADMWDKVAKHVRKKHYFDEFR